MVVYVLLSVVCLDYESVNIVLEKCHTHQVIIT